MPRLKIDDADLDIDELEDAEYNEDGDFEPYDGPEPPASTILVGLAKRMWWAYSSNNNPMIKVLFVAEDNVGDREKYNGWSTIDNVTLISTVKFRWKPFVDAFGLTIADVKKKTFVEDDDDRFGAPISKIGDFVPGSDAAWCRVLTKREYYEEKQEWNAKIGSGWSTPTRRPRTRRPRKTSQP